MTEDYRPCVRGCRYRGVHVEGCPGDDICRGCAPARAVEGLNLCRKDLDRLRTTLSDAADLCGHIRTLMDPAKATQFGEKLAKGKPPTAPAPVPADMIDAADAVIVTLVWWAQYMGDDTPYASFGVTGRGWTATSTPERGFAVAKWAADFIVDHLDELAADSYAGMFAKAVLSQPDDPEEWSIAKAIARFPMHSPPYWASKPCPMPACGLRTVRVTPPLRSGDRTSYDCRGCGWSPSSADFEAWVVYFEGVSAA